MERRNENKSLNTYKSMGLTALLHRVYWHTAGTTRHAHTYIIRKEIHLIFRYERCLLVDTPFETCQYSEYQ